MPFKQDDSYPRDMSNVLAVTGIPAAVVAHQGGWDEILLVVGPIAIVVGLLALARRRVRRLDRADGTRTRLGADVLENGDQRARKRT